jgi:hypothetical protein
LLKKWFSGVDEDLLVQSLETLKPIFRRDGRVTPEALGKSADFLVKAGAIKQGAPWKDIATYDYLPK